jgi:hypothetical protein
LAVPSAEAVVNTFKVAPSHPYVDDSVTITWRADRNLKDGQHYEGTLSTEVESGCASLVILNSKRRPKKGQTMSITFNPYQDRINGGPNWCDGKAEVYISVVKNGSDSSGSFVGITEFRFIQKP